MSDWRVCRLGDVAEVLDSRRVPVREEDRPRGSVAYYGANGQQGWIDRSLFDEPLVLLAEDGGHFEEFVDRPIAYRIDGPSWVNNHAHVLRAAAGVDQGYLFWSLRNKDIRHWIAGGTRSKLTRGEMEQIRITLPSLEEQRRIAKILDTIDEAIRASGSIIQKLQQLKKGLLLDVLQTYFPGSGPLPVRASHYVGECVLLSTLLESREIELGRGNVISSIDITNNPGPYPIYSSSASASGEFGKYGRFMFDEELITWSTDGGGRPFYRPRHRFSVTNVGGFLRIRANRHWTYRFVHALMEVQHSQLKFDWQTKAHPSVIRDLYWFPRVSLREQHQVANRLDVADATIQQEKAQMAKLDWLRAGLTADLLSGRVRTVAT